MRPDGLDRTPVLLTGEFGTGKRRAARRLHALGPDPEGPFRSVDASRYTPTLLASELFGHEKGAFTEARDRRDGVLHEARGGTLVLEEVTAIPVELQPRLLRLLETGSYTRLGGEVELTTDARIVVTARVGYPGELDDWASSGHLQADLLEAFGTGRIHLPPVREQTEADRRLLVEAILEEVGAAFPGVLRSLHPDTLGILLGHPWPGNVLEMRNVLEQALLTALGEEGVEGSPVQVGAEPLLPRHLPTELQTPVREPGAERRRGFRPESLEEVERRHIWLMLRHHGGNRSRSARDLGIARTTLLQKIARYGLEGAGR